MTSERCICIGIHIGSDPGRERRIFTFAAVDARRELAAIGPGDMQDLLAYLGGQSEAVVAVNAPQRLNCGLVARQMAESQLFPPEKLPRAMNLRLVEHQLRERGIAVPRTPARLEDCQRWVKQGFHLYSHLAELGYRMYPTEGAERQVLETQSEAVFWRLLGLAPFDARTLEGRLQRQLLLYNDDFPVEEPMRVLEEITSHRLLRGILKADELHSPPELSALAAALVAWLSVHHPKRLERTGAADEGQMTLLRGNLQG
jgi:hypothetical protein